MPGAEQSPGVNPGRILNFGRAGIWAAGPEADSQRGSQLRVGWGLQGPFTPHPGAVPRGSPGCSRPRPAALLPAPPLRASPQGLPRPAGDSAPSVTRPLLRPFGKLGRAAVLCAPEGHGPGNCQGPLLPAQSAAGGSRGPEGEDSGGFAKPWGLRYRAPAAAPRPWLQSVVYGDPGP